MPPPVAIAQQTLVQTKAVQAVSLQAASAQAALVKTQESVGMALASSFDDSIPNNNVFFPFDDNDANGFPNMNATCPNAYKPNNKNNDTNFFDAHPHSAVSVTHSVIS